MCRSSDKRQSGSELRGSERCAAEKAGMAASLNNYRSERNPISLNFLPPVPIHSFTAEGINPAFVIELPTKEKE